MVNKQNDKYSSLDEVEKSLNGLSNADLLRLDLVARNLVSFSQIVSPERLLKETIKSILEGTRRWPVHVEFLTFLCNALRSRADAYHKRQKGMFQQLSDDDPDPNMKTPEENMLISEDEKLLKSMYEEIWNLFQGDEAIEAILLGREEGLKPKEIQEQFGVSATQYASALRKMRRKLTSVKSLSERRN